MAQVKVIRQSSLSSECWMVQVWGTRYCKSCKFRGTGECGGKRIIETGRNELGHRIPVALANKEVGECYTAQNAEQK